MPDSFNFLVEQRLRFGSTCIGSYFIDMSVYITLRYGDVCLILVAKFIYISYTFCWELLELASIMGIETIIVHFEYT